MKKRFPYDILAAGLMILAGLWITLCLAGFLASALCCFCVATVILAYRLLGWLRKKRPQAGRILTVLFTVILCLVLLAAVITGYRIHQAGKGGDDRPTQYLIVLGCGVNGTTPSMSLSERIDGAYEYLSAHPDVICVASGGKGDGEKISEATCIRRELTARGIAEDRIWMEDKSTSTVENLRFSLALIEEKTGVRPTSAAVLSSAYHLFRADKMAAAQGLDMIAVPAKPRWMALYYNYLLREIVAVWYYSIFGG